MDTTTVTSSLSLLRSFTFTEVAIIFTLDLLRPSNKRDDNEPRGGGKRKWRKKTLVHSLRRSLRMNGNGFAQITESSVIRWRDTLLELFPPSPSLATKELWQQVRRSAAARHLIGLVDGVYQQMLVNKTWEETPTALSSFIKCNRAFIPLLLLCISSVHPFNQQ